MSDTKKCGGCEAFKKPDEPTPKWAEVLILVFGIASAYGVYAIKEESFAAWGLAVFIGFILLLAAYFTAKNNVIGGYTYYFNDDDGRRHLHNSEPSPYATHGILIREAVGGWRKRGAIFGNGIIPPNGPRIWTKLQWNVLRREYGALLLESRDGGTIPYGDLVDDPFSLIRRFNSVGEMVHGFVCTEQERDYYREALFVIVEQALSDRDRAKSQHAQAMRAVAESFLRGVSFYGASEENAKRLAELHAKYPRRGARKGAVDPMPPPASPDTSQGGPAAA